MIGPSTFHLHRRQAMNLKLTAILMTGIASTAIVRADDWPAFRGPSGNGASTEKSAPLNWAPDKNIKWKVALPQDGNGSPAVSNGLVFVACSEDPKGKRRSLYCFDRKDGKQKWIKTVEFGKEEKTHETNPHCSSTPAADGKHVVVWHGSAGLHCYDFEGKETWSRDLGEFVHIWGFGTSPLIYEGKVILNTGPGKRIFVAAFDVETGKTIWEADEPMKGDGEHNEAGQWMGSWSTPVVAKVDGKDNVICTLPTRVAGFDPKDGKLLWWCDGVSHKKGDLSYSSPVVGDGLCLVIGGFGGPGFAAKLGGSGDLTANRLWRLEDRPQSIGSGIFVDGYVYQPQAGPDRIECIDPKTGKVVWKDRGAGGAYWGSVVSAAGRLYVTSQKGATVVFKPNPEKFELLATNALNETCNATPAVSNGEIFIRTYKHLYCIAE